MKKRNAKKASTAKAKRTAAPPKGPARQKRTGPSRRTAAERKAIDTRAALASRDAKRKSRKQNKVDKALAAKCPTCRAAPGVQCFARDGRQVPTPHRLRTFAMPAKPRSIAAALAPLVVETAGNKGRNGTAAPVAQHASPGVPTIAIANIIIGKRHRKDFSHVPEIAASINERGGLISPISLRPDRTLIAGECRIKAWQQSKFAGQPIPFHVLDVDSIIAGEWDENSKRKDFTPAEAVAIKRDVEKEFARLQAERAKSDRAAPGRKASGVAAGRIADRAAKFAGKDRRTIEKAEKVVDAAAREPEKYGDLVDEMNRTGKVNAVSKKLKVREAKAAIEKAPPAMPMNAKQCATWVIDFPWAGEMERDQAALDAAGRSFRPYPEMSNKTVCQFARDAIAPHLPDDVAIWLLVTNFILVRGYHLHVYGALGFKPENAATMLTWGKDKIGRGQILRDQTEHAILLTRGRVTIDVTGANPPSTLLLAPRRENSRKPDEFWRMVERVTPAKRYASIFSQGGEGENWDSHGDQVGKFAPAIARAAEADAIEEATAGDNLAAAREATAAAAADAQGFDVEHGSAGTSYSAQIGEVPEELQALTHLSAGGELADWAIERLVEKRLVAVTGKRKKKIALTALGSKRLAELQAAAAAPPAADEKSKPGMLFTIRTCGDQGRHQAPHGHYLSLVMASGGRQHTACECGTAFSVVEAHETPKVEAEIVAHWRAVSPLMPAAPPIDELVALEALAAGDWPSVREQPGALERFKALDAARYVAGRKEIRLTIEGLARLDELRQAAAQIDLEEAIAAKDAPAPLDPAAIAAFEDADLYRVPQDVVDAIGQLGGHVVARTIDWDSGEKGYSVATCECGATFRADRTLPYSGENAIAPQIEAHWRAQLGAADKPALFSAEQPAEPGAAVPAIAASAEGDDLDIPAFLRRSAENKAPA